MKFSKGLSGQHIYEVKKDHMVNVAIADFTMVSGSTTVGRYAILNPNGLGMSGSFQSLETVIDFKDEVNNANWLTHDDIEFIFEGLNNIENHFKNNLEEKGAKITMPKIQPPRINKTASNLKRIWNYLDNASGDIDNAITNINLMRNIPDRILAKLERIDLDLITSVKNDIELLIEEKEDK